MPRAMGSATVSKGLMLVLLSMPIMLYGMDMARCDYRGEDLAHL